ncbi:MAG: galactose-6-phosphate isomerase subunit LacA, partial [Atopobiaceae bacterium]|nr:galactose-6-phosphate isomerase subunit LacA [Atopobiaceae bacterium]
NRKGTTMRIVIGSDAEGMPLKETVKAYLIERGDEVVDKSEQPAADFVDSATAVAHDLMDNPDSLGFAFDRYGAGSYMAACKVKGMIPCECSDERSAYMTRQHNNARMIVMGSGIVGPDLARGIVDEFLSEPYAGGRHQVRVDMLNKMA